VLEGFPAGDDESGFAGAPGVEELEDTGAVGDAVTDPDADTVADPDVAADVPAASAPGVDPPPPEHPATTRTAAATTIETLRIAPPFTPDTAMLATATSGGR
jgi:hypothetical protein